MNEDSAPTINLELSKLEIVQLTTLVIYAFNSMRRYGETNLPTRISDVSDKFKFKIIDRSTLWHQVQPPKMNTFYISLEASHDTNISKYYSHAFNTCI